MEKLLYNPRQTGKTTRLIDLSIQQLFTFGSITIPLHVNMEVKNKYKNEKRKNTNN